MTMTLQQLAPRHHALDIDVEVVTAELHTARQQTKLAPFSDTVIAFFDSFSARLAASPEARRHAELQALAFWLRKSELIRLRERFVASIPMRCIAVPRGLAFHIAPSNVDTVSMYSMALSMLCGNATLVRASSRESSQTKLMTDALAQTAEEPAFAEVKQLCRIVRYGHDAAINAYLSMQCDVRVIWGGDATIQEIRKAPLNVFGRDLSFPDRTAYAVLAAAAYLALEPRARVELAARFFNDTYLFNQLACSSPRIVFWLGEPSEVKQASAIFFEQLEATLRDKRYRIEPHTMLDKLAFCFSALAELETGDLRRHAAELMVVSMAKPAWSRTSFCGGGVFFEVGITELDEIAAFASRKDQTLTHFGLDEATLRAFATGLNGRGLDRIVPIGRGLEFSHLWDGMDLLREFIRLVHVA